MSAGKVLALIVVVVSFAIVAVAVSWCCWCIRARFFGDKHIQPVKSAATVADTLESSRQKSSGGSLPVPAACPSESKLVTAPGASAGRGSSCSEKQKLSVRLPDVESPEHSKIRKDSHYCDYASQLSLEPLVAQNLYQRKSSKLDLFSREHSLLSSSDDSPLLHTTTYKAQTELGTKARSLEEGLSMARLSERKQSKFDFFSRENSLMDTNSIEESDKGHNQTRLEEELLADLRKEGMTVQAPRKLSVGKKELLRGFHKEHENDEGNKEVNTTWGSPPCPSSPAVPAQSTPSSAKSSKSSRSSKASKTSKKSHKHKERHAKDVASPKDEPLIPTPSTATGNEAPADDKLKHAKKPRKSKTKHSPKDENPPGLADQEAERALVPAEAESKALPENPLQ